MRLIMDDYAAPARPIVFPYANGRDVVAATYDTHQRELFSLALRSSRDPAIAEEVVQEAFIRLIVEIGAGRSPDNMRAWLYRVIANLVVSGGRSAAVARRQLGALVKTDVDEGPEPAYLVQERQTDLEKVLAELDVDARTALVMAASGFKGWRSPRRSGAAATPRGP